MKVLGIFIVIALLGGAAGIFGSSTRRPVPRQRRPGASLHVHHRKRDIRFAVKRGGEITPSEQVSVRPEVNGGSTFCRWISAIS